MSNKALYCTHVCIRLSSFRQSMSVCNVMYKNIGRKIFTDWKLHHISMRITLISNYFGIVSYEIYSLYSLYVI